MGGGGGGGWHPGKEPPSVPVPNPDPKPDDKSAINHAYTTLRHACAALEEAIEARGDLTDKQRKRLDKAVTLMKFGFKIVKKSIGKSEITPWRETPPNNREAH